MSSRYERMLEAIAKGEKITEEPICRREIFLKALANKEGASNLPTPICREEEFYKAIIKGEKITKEPICKKEEYLKALANGEEMPECSVLNCKEEALFRKVCSSSIGGGGNTPSTPTTYSVTFGNGVTVLNGSTKLTSGTKVESGTKLTISYTLSEGHHLGSFKVNGVDAQNNSTIIITSNTSITFSELKNSYKLTFDEGVTVLYEGDSIGSNSVLLYGSKIIVSYTLSEGYTLTSFQVNGEDVENGSTITVTEPINITFTQEEDSSSGGSTLTFSRTFSENSPEVIAAVGNEIAYNGLTSVEVETNYGWKLGDTVSYTLSTGENVEMRIIGFNHDDLSDGSGKAGITLEMTHGLATRYAMNAKTTSSSYGTNAGGFPASLMNTSTLPAIKATIPQEWRDVIKMVDKKSANGGKTNYSAIVTSSEDLFLLAQFEMFGDVGYSQVGIEEGSQYEYWIGKSNADRIKNQIYEGTPNTPYLSWLRSCYASRTEYFCMVNTDGSYSANRSVDPQIVSFAFCVGAASDYNSGGSGDTGGDTGGDSLTFSRTFSENTPAQISAVSAEISANNMTSEQVAETYGWNIGDTISYQLTTGENVEMRIIGFNHDDKSDGSGKAGITLDMTHCLAARYKMNSTGTNKGGYATSLMKTTTLPSIKGTIPQEWQDVIKLVDKKSANGGSSNYSNILTLSEDIFLLSGGEVCGSQDEYAWSQNGANEGSQYEYWIGKSASDRIKKANSTAVIWWLRSSGKYATNTFCSFIENGAASMQSSDNNYYASFAFCV